MKLTAVRRYVPHLALPASVQSCITTDTSSFPKPCGGGHCHVQAGVYTQNSYFIVAHGNSLNFFIYNFYLRVYMYIHECVHCVYVHGCVGPGEAGRWVGGCLIRIVTLVGTLCCSVAIWTSFMNQHIYWFLPLEYMWHTYLHTYTWHIIATQSLPCPRCWPRTLGSQMSAMHASCWKCWSSTATTVWCRWVGQVTCRWGGNRNGWNDDTVNVWCHRRAG